MTDNGARILPFLKEDLIVKNMYNVQSASNITRSGQRIYRRLKRNLEYLGAEKWINATSLQNSGIIDHINKRCAELNITAKEFVFSDYMDEVAYKYDTNFSAKKYAFYRSYKEYLV